MSVANIRTQIFNIVDAVTDSGMVYDRVRYHNEWNEFLNFFKVTISTVDQIRGFEVEYKGQETLDAQMNPNVLRAHRWWVHGFLGVSDALETEKTFSTLIETVCNALDNDATLHNGQTYFNTSPASVPVLEHRTSPTGGGVLVHYAQIELTVTEFIA